MGPMGIAAIATASEGIASAYGGLAVVRNIGALDRLLRFYLGLAMIGFALPFWAPQTGWNWIGWLGIVPLVSSLAGTCGLYRLIGVTTCSR